MGTRGEDGFFFRALLFQGRFPSRHGSGNPKRRGSPGGAPGGSGRKAAAGCGSGSSPPEPRRCREGGAAGRAPPYSRGVGGVWGGGRCPAPFPSPPLPPRRCRSLIAAAGGRRKKKIERKENEKRDFRRLFVFRLSLAAWPPPGGLLGSPRKRARVRSHVRARARRGRDENRNENCAQPLCPRIYTHTESYLFIF